MENEKLLSLENLLSLAYRVESWNHSDLGEIKYSSGNIYYGASVHDCITLAIYRRSKSKGIQEHTFSIEAKYYHEYIGRVEQQPEDSELGKFYSEILKRYYNYDILAETEVKLIEKRRKIISEGLRGARKILGA